MKVAIINRFSNRTVDYAEALKDVKAEFLFITRTKHKELFNDFFKDRKVFDSFDTDELENYLLSLKEKGVYLDKIVATHEFDIEKAAKIREKLELQGQTVSSATDFRDKEVMKRKLREVVKIPRFSKINNISDLIKFKKLVGLPFIIKPIDGAGSIGFHKFTDELDFDRYTKSSNKDREIYPLLAEEFIEGEMYHLDGIFEDNEIKVFEAGLYINGCLAYLENKYNGSVLIKTNSVMYNRLKGEVVKVLRKLDTPNHAIAFHCEFFYTPKDELIFCEIGCRVGGGRINEVFELKYGVNLLNESIRAQCDPSYYFDKNKIHESSGTYGWMLVPPEKAVLVSVNEKLSFSWLIDASYRKNKIGADLGGADSSVSEYVSFITKGDDEQEVRDRMELLDQWLKDNTIWKHN